jgi:hypothetical protein
MNNITIIAILVGVVGFFLRDLHTRLKQAEKDIALGHDKIIEYKSKMEQLDSVQRVGFSHMEKLFDEKFKSIDKTLEHMNNNIKASHDLFAIIIKEQEKK